MGLLYETTPAATLDQQPFALADDLSRRLGRTVDLVVLNSAPADLRMRVLREGELLLQPDDATRIRFEVATRNEYFDLEPILREYRRPRKTT